MGKTHFKPLAARHGRETAWARHAMCESAFTEHDLQNCFEHWQHRMQLCANSKKKKYFEGDHR
jgi:hypothetical protein